LDANTGVVEEKGVISKDPMSKRSTTGFFRRELAGEKTHQEQAKQIRQEDKRSKSPGLFRRPLTSEKTQQDQPKQKRQDDKRSKSPGLFRSEKTQQEQPKQKRHDDKSSKSPGLFRRPLTGEKTKQEQPKQKRQDDKRSKSPGLFRRPLSVEESRLAEEGNNQKKEQETPTKQKDKLTGQEYNQENMRSQSPLAALFRRPLADEETKQQHRSKEQKNERPKSPRTPFHRPLVDQQLKEKDTEGPTSPRSLFRRPLADETTQQEQTYDQVDERPKSPRALFHRPLAADVKSNHGALDTHSTGNKEAKIVKRSRSKHGESKGHVGKEIEVVGVSGSNQVSSEEGTIMKRSQSKGPVQRTLPSPMDPTADVLFSLT